MAGWDYLVKPVPACPEQLEELGVLGRDSWELVAVCDGNMYFKRYANYDQLRDNVAAEGQNMLTDWVADPSQGQRKIESITSEDDDLKGVAHKHRVVAIVDRGMVVLHGATDAVNGHVHGVNMIGVVDEADGHTHTFEVF